MPKDNSEVAERPSVSSTLSTEGIAIRFTSEAKPDYVAAESRLNKRMDNEKLNLSIPELEAVKSAEHALLTGDAKAVEKIIKDVSKDSASIERFVSVVQKDLSPYGLDVSLHKDKLFIVHDKTDAVVFDITGGKTLFIPNPNLTDRRFLGNVDEQLQRFGSAAIDQMDFGKAQRRLNSDITLEKAKLNDSQKTILHDLEHMVLTGELDLLDGYVKHFRGKPTILKNVVAALGSDLEKHGVRVIYDEKQGLMLAQGKTGLMLSFGDNQPRVVSLDKSASVPNPQEYLDAVAKTLLEAKLTTAK